MLGERGSSSTSRPSLRSSIWCCLDFSARVRWICLTIMSIATRFCIPLGTIISKAIISNAAAGRFVGNGFKTCILPLWLDVALVVGFNVCDPLLDAAFYVPTPFLYVASNLSLS